MDQADGRSQSKAGRTATTSAEMTSPLPFSASVVAPVYNSQATLAELTTRIEASLTPLVQGLEIIPGFAFLASEIALFAGMQLSAFGVMGEHMARPLFRTMGKPLYVIRDEVGGGLPA